MPNVRLMLNGKETAVECDAGETLLEVLRERLDLTGTKYGCGEGLCGACTVLIDGEAARSCVTPAAALRGKKVTTIEGLAAGANLHPLQQAFLEATAFQCGFCTPGMVMGAAALLRRNRRPAEGDIREALEGHICRCGTYPRIVEAVRMAAAKGGSR